MNETKKYLADQRRAGIEAALKAYFKTAGRKEMIPKICKTNKSKGVRKSES